MYTSYIVSTGDALWQKAERDWTDKLGSAMNECNIIAFMERSEGRDEGVTASTLSSFLITMQNLGWSMVHLKVLADHYGYHVFPSEHTLSCSRKVG